MKSNPSDAYPSHNLPQHTLSAYSAPTKSIPSSSLPVTRRWDSWEVLFQKRLKFPLPVDVLGWACTVVLVICHGFLPRISLEALRMVIVKSAFGRIGTWVRL